MHLEMHLVPMAQAASRGAVAFESLQDFCRREAFCQTVLFQHYLVTGKGHHVKQVENVFHLVIHSYWPDRWAVQEQLLLIAGLKVLFVPNSTFR